MGMLRRLVAGKAWKKNAQASAKSSHMNKTFFQVSLAGVQPTVAVRNAQEYRFIHA
jgi:hypothetical protein